MITQQWPPDKRRANYFVYFLASNEFELAPVFILTVMSVESPGVLDTCFAELPLHQTLGDQIHTRFTPLRQYEGFATDLSERAGSDTKYEEGKGVLKQGLFYLFTWTVEYDSGMIWINPRGIALGTGPTGVGGKRGVEARSLLSFHLYTEYDSGMIWINPRGIALGTGPTGVGGKRGVEARSLLCSHFYSVRVCILGGS